LVTDISEQPLAVMPGGASSAGAAALFFSDPDTFADLP